MKNLSEALTGLGRGGDSQRALAYATFSSRAVAAGSPPRRADGTKRQSIVVPLLIIVVSLLCRRSALARTRPLAACSER